MMNDLDPPMDDMDEAVSQEETAPRFLIHWKGIDQSIEKMQASPQALCQYLPEFLRYIRDSGHRIDFADLRQEYISLLDQKFNYIYMEKSMKEEAEDPEDSGETPHEDAYRDIFHATGGTKFSEGPKNDVYPFSLQDAFVFLGRYQRIQDWELASLNKQKSWRKQGQEIRTMMKKVDPATDVYVLLQQEYAKNREARKRLYQFRKKALGMKREDDYKAVVWLGKQALNDLLRKYSYLVRLIVEQEVEGERRNDMEPSSIDDLLYEGNTALETVIRSFSRSAHHSANISQFRKKALDAIKQRLQHYSKMHAGTKNFTESVYEKQKMYREAEQKAGERSSKEPRGQRPYKRFNLIWECFNLQIDKCAARLILPTEKAKYIPIVAACIRLYKSKWNQSLIEWPSPAIEALLEEAISAIYDDQKKLNMKKEKAMWMERTASLLACYGCDKDSIWPSAYRDVTKKELDQIRKDIMMCDSTSSLDAPLDEEDSLTLGGTISDKKQEAPAGGIEETEVESVERLSETIRSQMTAEEKKIFSLCRKYPYFTSQEVTKAASSYFDKKESDITSLEQDQMKQLMAKTMIDFLQRLRSKCQNHQPPISEEIVSGLDEQIAFYEKLLKEY